MPHLISGRRRAAVAAFATAIALLSPALLSAPAHAAAPLGSPASTQAYAGVIPFTAADVTSIGGSDWTVSWSAPADVTSVQVFVGTDAATFPATAAATSTTATGAVTISSVTRPWVKLVASYGAPLVVSSRSLGLTSDANLRDAGGYRTATGQWVKEGVVLRSQALSISSAEQPTFDALGVSSDYDLRTTCEAKQSPDYVPAGVTYAHLNVAGDGDTDTNNCPASQIPSGITADQAAGYMVQGEVGFVDSDTAKAAYRSLYAGILGDTGVSLYHCTAGKDRTGWASAALLTLLGVPADDVMRDYLLSNTYYYKTAGLQTIAYMNSLSAGSGDAIAPMMQVRAEYLQAGLDRVAHEYGSMENYFVNGLGLTRTQVEGLRAKLLTGAAIPASSSTATQTPGKIAVAKPTLTGRARVGATLKGHLTVPAGTTVSYRWLADGKAIGGATRPKLKLTRSLKGKRVTLRAVVAASGYTSATVTSKAVKVKG